MHVRRAQHAKALRASLETAQAQVDGEALFKALTGFDARMTLSASSPVMLTMRDSTMAREDMLHLTVKAMERLLARMERQSA